jgi:preprotein translocase subunit SecA
LLFRLAKRIFDRQSTEIRKLRRIVSHIDRHYRQLSSSSDEQLQSLSQELRSKAKEERGSPLMKVEAFALDKEAVRRISGKTLHDVQLMGGWAMTERNIAEMATGEGKTATFHTTHLLVRITGAWRASHYRERILGSTGLCGDEAHF